MPAVPPMPDKRQRIITAAQHELARCGGHGLTMAAVARAAKVATGTLYLYFADKQAVLDAVQLHVMQQTAEAICSHDDPHQPLAMRVQGYWRRLFAFFINNPELLRCWQYYIHARDYVPEQVIEQQSAMFAPLVQLMNEALQQQLVQPWPPRLLALFALDSAVSLANKQHFGLLPPLDDATLQQLAQASWQGIALVAENTQRSPSRD